MNLDQDVAAYISDLTDYLRQQLAGDFVGAYLHGSLTMAAFQPGKSDIDLLVTVRRSVSSSLIDDLQSGVSALPLPAQVRGLDLELLSASTAQHLTEDSRWEATFRVVRTLLGQEGRAGKSFDPLLFVEVELLRQYGVTLAGPSVARSFGPVARHLILRSCAENCRVWASRTVFNDPASGVLNVCRAWRYLDEGWLGSKPAAGEWAKTRLNDSSLVEAALASRRGEPGSSLNDKDVKAFCEQISSLFSN